MKIDEIADSFGRAVRQARENRQWTQADLAARLGVALGKEVNPLAVTRIESGKRPVPLQEVAALAGLLGLEIDPLINPAPVRLGHAELMQRAADIRDELSEAHQSEVRLMAAYASANQQLRDTRTRKEALERELQAIEREARRHSEDGKQEH